VACPTAAALAPPVLELLAHLGPARLELTVREVLGRFVEPETRLYA
jgi:hypothetical protein